MEWSSVKLKKVIEDHPKPDLTTYGYNIINALSALSGDRINTNGMVSEVPFSAVREYMDWIGIEDQQLFFDIFKSADRKWVEIYTKKINSKKQGS